MKSLGRVTKSANRFEVRRDALSRTDACGVRGRSRVECAPIVPTTSIGRKSVAGIDLSTGDSIVSRGETARWGTEITSVSNVVLYRYVGYRFVDRSHVRSSRRGRISSALKA